MTQIDKSLARVQYPPICLNCLRFNRDTLDSCTAFPANDSIPDAIWNGDNPHTQPYPGDQGFRFERRT